MACQSELPALPGGGCPVCALPTGNGLVCGPCQRFTRAFDSSVAAFRYEFPVDVMIQGLKYGHRLPLGSFFANALEARLSAEDVPDVVMPLPLHPNRLRQRGFNQAAEIARPLARRLGCELRLVALIRDLDTPPQVGLPWAERVANVRGAFRCVDDLRGLRIAVVDDVLTTGATLHEVARCLKGRGAIRVDNWLVARTV